MQGGPSAASSADPYFHQRTSLSWRKVRREVQVADAPGTGDDLATGVVPLGAQPDVLRMAALLRPPQAIQPTGVDECCDLAFLVDVSRS